MPDRFEWWHWLAAAGFLALGGYTLVTGDWLGRGNPNPTMARVGGGAITLIALLGLGVGISSSRNTGD